MLGNITHYGRIQVPLNFPEKASDIDARSKADVQRELGQARPFLKNSWLGAIVTSCSNRIYDFYLQLKIALRENFPDSATTDFLVRWAAIWGKQRLAASKASGNIVATGNVGSNIPNGTVFTSPGIGNYTSTASANIISTTINISSLTRVGTTVTAVTTSSNDLANNVLVAINLASNTEYNVVSTPITVTGDDSFQYSIIGSPPDEPSTNATASFISATVPVESDEFGVTYNLDAGSYLQTQSPIVGVDQNLTVGFGSIGGGTDQEDDLGLRSRMLDRIQNPVALFNKAAIREKAKEIAGVTRVFVQEVTPNVGQVTIYFMRDNDPNPIPTGSEVIKVKNNVLTIKPAHVLDEDVIVNAPASVSIDFVFSALSPNTATMKSAINANLRQFFDERTNIGEDVTQDAYRSAIYNTIDPDTGDSVQSFTLSAPTTDIAIASGQIGVLGAISYS